MGTRGSERYKGRYRTCNAAEETEKEGLKIFHPRTQVKLARPDGGSGGDGFYGFARAATVKIRRAKYVNERITSCKSEGLQRRKPLTYG